MQAVILNKDIWCRNGLSVTRTRYESDSVAGCLVREIYSDGGTATEDGSSNPWIWVLWECNNMVDVVTTCVAENSNLYYMKFDEDTNTYRIFDFNNVDVTGTVTPINCGGSSSVIAGGRDYTTTGGEILSTVLWYNTINSITIVPTNDVSCVIDGYVIVLKANNAYTRWTNGAQVNVTWFQFTTAWISIKIIYERTV